jgi:hypothetical protein
MEYMKTLRLDAPRKMLADVRSMIQNGQEIGSAGDNGMTLVGSQFIRIHEVHYALFAP